MTLIRNARIFRSTETDVRWDGEDITECGTGLRPIPGEDDIDARGGWLLPGLHDHHIHLRALAARARSIPVGPPETADADVFADRLRTAARGLPPGGWLRAVGYHESVAGELDRWSLDRVLDTHAVRVQHRSGALWTLNSRACRLLQVDDCPLPGVERDHTGRSVGRLWRMDAWLGERLNATKPDPTELSARAAALGVTGFTDATPDLRQDEVDSLAEDVAQGRILQRVHCMTPPGIVRPDSPRFTLGPTKFLLDDPTLPTLPDLIDRFRAVHEAGKCVAVHCVTRIQLIVTIAALQEAGVREGDRIEHGAIIPAESLEWLRPQGITIITQPNFPVERAEQYARTIPPEDQPDLWRLGSILTAGVPVAAGTDAPFGNPDPWRAVRAATGRTLFGTHEQISAPEALTLFLGHPDQPAAPRSIAPGHPADLTLLRVPPRDLPTAMTSPDLVAATIIAGKPVHMP